MAVITFRSRESSESSLAIVPPEPWSAISRSVDDDAGAKDHLTADFCRWNFPQRVDHPQLRLTFFGRDIHEVAAPPQFVGHDSHSAHMKVM